VAADVAATGPDATANAAARRDARPIRCRRRAGAALDRQNREDSDRRGPRHRAVRGGVRSVRCANWVVRPHRAAMRRDRQIGSPSGCRTPGPRTKRAPSSPVTRGAGPGATVVVTGEDDRSPAAPLVARGDRTARSCSANRELRDSTERWVHDSSSAAGARHSCGRGAGTGGDDHRREPMVGRGRASAEPPRRPAHRRRLAVAMIDVDRFKRERHLRARGRRRCSWHRRRPHRRASTTSSMARRRRVHRATPGLDIPQPPSPWSAGHPRRRAHNGTAGLGDRELRRLRPAGLTRSHWCGGPTKPCTKPRREAATR
jgi:hypothetical protein